MPAPKCQCLLNYVLFFSNFRPFVSRRNKKDNVIVWHASACCDVSQSIIRLLLFLVDSRSISEYVTRLGSEWLADDTGILASNVDWLRMMGDTSKLQLFNNALLKLFYFARVLDELDIMGMLWSLDKTLTIFWSCLMWNSLTFPACGTASSSRIAGETDDDWWCSCYIVYYVH